jgi:hypothetical protein
MGQQGGATWVPCSINVTKGDIIGVVGSRSLSDGGVAHSYGAASTYASAIFGQPVTLGRLFTNVNLVDAGTYTVSTETANAFSRIELLYSE